MPLPSFYKSAEPAHAWNVSRAAVYGALLGLLAALFRRLGPFAHSGGGPLTNAAAEVAFAVLAFALLCAAAALLRNFLLRRLIDQETRQQRPFHD